MSVTIDGTTGVSKIQDGVIETADLIDATVTPAKLAQPFSSGTAVASTSGTSIDFTSIPSWVKRITVMFSGVSTNGSSNGLVQLGSGSVQTSGYAGAAADGPAYGATSFTAGFGIRSFSASNCVVEGSVTITNVSGNVWVLSGVLSRSDAAVAGLTAGRVSLSGALDRVRITTVNGTDTFDAGSINILFE